MNFYTEDTVKLTSKLTVDASLRWDFNTAWKEVNGQWSNFVLDAVNTSWTPLKGDYQYLSNGSQSFEKNQDWRLFSPHAGASYQISSKLVARGSWALSYVPLGINQWGGAPFAGEAYKAFLPFEYGVSSDRAGVLLHWARGVPLHPRRKKCRAATSAGATLRCLPLYAW